VSPIPERSERHRPGRDDYKDVAPAVARLRALDESSGEASALRDEVITRCLPLADHIARRFGGRGEAHEDLLQVARLGLVKAVDRFDPDRGFDFVSYAVPTIMGEVRRYFRDTGWSMRVPRRMQELHALITKAVDELSQELGRSPSASEIAAELELDVREVSEGLLAKNAYQTLSMDAAMGDDPDDLPLAETLGEEDPELANVESHAAVRPALEKLPPLERRVLMLRFFGSMTQTEIAQRVGVSQMQVSRILARTLSGLREQLGGG